MAADSLLTCDPAISWYDFTYPLSWSHDCEVSTSLPRKPELTAIGCANTLRYPFHICGDPHVWHISFVSRDERGIPVSAVVLRPVLVHVLISSSPLDRQVRFSFPLY